MNECKALIMGTDLAMHKGMLKRLERLGVEVGETPKLGSMGSG